MGVEMLSWSWRRAVSFAATAATLQRAMSGDSRPAWGCIRTDVFNCFPTYLVYLKCALLFGDPPNKSTRDTLKSTYDQRTTTLHLFI